MDINSDEALKHTLQLEMDLAILKSPDILAFLKLQGAVLKILLGAKGYGYAMPKAPGQGPQYVFGDQIGDIFGAKTSQPSSIGQVMGYAWAQKQSVFLPAQGHQELNPTGLSQYFIPIIANEQLIGLIHMAFDGADVATEVRRKGALEFAASTTQTFLAINSAPDLAQEAARMSASVHLFEELAGDHEIETVSWNLVNFTREAVPCTRVCLFTLKGYSLPDQKNELPPIYQRKYLIQACSGLKKTHPRSEHAVILAELSKTLFEIALKNHPQAPQGSLATAGQVALPMAFTQRDPTKRAQRPASINTYFDRMPMHWAAVLPLVDREGKTCGMILFEGQKPLDNLQTALLRMRGLAISAGKAVSTALIWEQKKPLKIASYWAKWRASLTRSKRTILLKKTGLSIAVGVAVLLCPLPYRVVGPATLIPIQNETIATTRVARVMEVFVQPGESVHENDPLCQLGVMQLDLAISQTQQELAQAEATAKRAQAVNDEGTLQLALHEANQIEAQLDRLELEKMRSTLKAPFDGVILGPHNLAQLKGEVLMPGTPLVYIANLEHWKVQTNIRESDFIYLQKRLERQGPMYATLSLISNPTRLYDLELTSQSQLSFSTDTLKNDYTYSVNLPFTAEVKDGQAGLKSHYLGEVAIYAGWRPIYYILFHDFANFLEVRNL